MFSFFFFFRIQKMSSMLSIKEDSLRRLKEDLRRAQQRGEESCKTAGSPTCYMEIIWPLTLERLDCGCVVSSAGWGSSCKADEPQRSGGPEQHSAGKDQAGRGSQTTSAENHWAGKVTERIWTLFWGAGDETEEVTRVSRQLGVQSAGRGRQVEEQSHQTEEQNWDGRGPVA